MDSIMLERGNNRDVPKWIVLQLLEACNLRCRMCYEWGDGGSYIGKKKLDTLSLQKVKEVIDECETAHPYYELFGGEPLLYPDIFEVIEYIHQKGSKVDMATNGTLLEKNEEALACSGISRIWVSIDGDEETNDLQRGAGVFKKAVSGIQKIKDIRRDKKPKVGITTIVTPKNANVLAKNFFEFAANCPIDHISIEFQNYATSKEYEEYKVFLKNNFGIGEAEAAKGYVRDTEEFAGIDCGTLSEDMVRIKQYCAEHDIKMFHNPNVISKENWLFLNFGYNSIAIKPSDKCSDGLTYIRSIRVKSLVLIKKASLHFLVRLTILDLPYTIRLMSLNLLLFPSTNPELTSMDIAFLTEAISFFKLLQKDDSFVSAYFSKYLSIFSGSSPISIS